MYYSSNFQLTKTFPTDAGFDLPFHEELFFRPFEQICVNTKTRISIPTGYYGQLMLKSSAAQKYPLIIQGGVIDSDYTGELKCLLLNASDKAFKIPNDKRIVQLVVIKIYDYDGIKLSAQNFEKIIETKEQSRGNKGFGEGSAFVEETDEQRYEKAAMWYPSFIPWTNKNYLDEKKDAQKEIDYWKIVNDPENENKRIPIIIQGTQFVQPFIGKDEIWVTLKDFLTMEESNSIEILETYNGPISNKSWLNELSFKIKGPPKKKKKEEKIETNNEEKIEEKE